LSKRIYETAVLLIMLALLSLACQRASQPGGNQSAAANTTGNTGGAQPAGQPPAAPKTSLKVGDAAPDFTLNDTNGNAVKLSDFRGRKNVVLAFYVLAFTGG
jgi:cytochrome oxidase Cu insertion factor (SCO1/SenC/PrrC family)